MQARAYVLCAGGVENARLLLDSDAIETDGVGNRRGLVGRFFQEHPNGMTAAIRPDGSAELQERFSLLYRRRLRFFPNIVLGAERQREREVLNAVAYPVYEFGPDTALASARAISRAVRLGERPPDLRRRLRRITADARPLAVAAARRVTTGRSPMATPVAIRLHTPTPSSAGPRQPGDLVCRAGRPGGAARAWTGGSPTSSAERRGRSPPRSRAPSRGSASATCNRNGPADDGDGDTWEVGAGRLLPPHRHHADGRHPRRRRSECRRPRPRRREPVRCGQRVPDLRVREPDLMIVVLALRLADHLRTIELRAERADRTARRRGPGSGAVHRLGRRLDDRRQRRPPAVGGRDRAGPGPRARRRGARRAGRGPRAASACAAVLMTLGLPEALTFFVASRRVPRPWPSGRAARWPSAPAWPGRSSLRHAPRGCCIASPMPSRSCSFCASRSRP